MQPLPRVPADLYGGPADCSDADRGCPPLQGPVPKSEQILLPLETCPGPRRTSDANSEIWGGIPTDIYVGVCQFLTPLERGKASRTRQVQRMEIRDSSPRPAVETLQERFDRMSIERMGQAGMLKQPSRVLSRTLLTFLPRCDPAPSAAM